MNSICGWSEPSTSDPTAVDFLLIWHNRVAKITPFRSCKDLVRASKTDKSISYFHKERLPRNSNQQYLKVYLFVWSSSFEQLHQIFKQVQKLHLIDYLFEFFLTTLHIIYSCLLLECERTHYFLKYKKAY
jgi:hypothetical protein